MRLFAFSSGGPWLPHSKPYEYASCNHDNICENTPNYGPPRAGGEGDKGDKNKGARATETEGERRRGGGRFGRKGHRVPILKFGVECHRSSDSTILLQPYLGLKQCRRTALAANTNEASDEPVVRVRRKRFLQLVWQVEEHARRVERPLRSRSCLQFVQANITDIAV